MGSLNQEKILLFGGSGFLGSVLPRYFKDKMLIIPSHDNVNLQQIKKVLTYIEIQQPASIIYSAGITSIDFAEENPELTYDLNTNIPGKIARYAAANNIRFLYISTDAVFDAHTQNYRFTEHDTPKSRTVYGISKLNGENEVLSANANYTIVRLITLYGLHHTKPNFVALMLDRLRKNQEFSGLIDQIRNPLYVDVAAEAISYISRNNLTGIYHLGALDEDTNYNFLLKIADAFGLNKKLIKKKEYTHFLKEKKGFRAQKSVLICDKLDKESNHKILKTLDESIKLLYMQLENFSPKK